MYINIILSCIAGNFRRRKLLQIGEKYKFSRRKHSQIARFCCAKGHHTPKTLQIATKQIYESFLPRMFSATVVFRAQFQLKCSVLVVHVSLPPPLPTPPPTGQGVHPWCDQAPVWETPSLPLPQRHPRREKGRMKEFISLVPRPSFPWLLAVCEN